MMGEDACIVVTVDDIKTFEKLKLISQMAPVKERINSLERKHGCSFKACSKIIQISSDVGAVFPVPVNMR